jgi:hypothetical protein
MLRYFFFILFVFCAHTNWAQTGTQPLRIELEARPNTEPYQLIPLGDDGILVLTRTNEFEDRNNRKWILSLYNQTFEKQWEQVQLIYRNHDYAAWALSGSEVSLLFFDPRASTEYNLQVLTMKFLSKQLHLAEANIDRRFEPVRFAKHGDYCYIGMNSKNACKAYRIHTVTGDLQSLELNPDGGVFIENINIDTIANQVVMLTSLRNERRRNALFLHYFDKDGNESSFNAIIKNENRKMVTSAEFVPVSRQNALIMGSYTSNPPRRSATSSDAIGSASTGFYKVLISNDHKPPVVEFYSFSNFVNLENYIRGTVAEKRQRSQRRWFQGRRSDGFEHHLVVHDIKQKNGVYLLAGEAFTPDFRTVTTIAYDYYGRPVPRSYSVFDGYRYSHAVVAAFDGNGNFLWDNGIEMINIRTFDLNPKVVIFNDNEGLAMAYNHDGKIAWKLIRERKTITNISYANIETRYTKDRVNSEQSSRLFYWYNQYFLASGYQGIINNYLPEQNRRSVFYINKIAFD